MAKIVIVSLGEGTTVDDYTFHSDGKVDRNYTSDIELLNHAGQLPLSKVPVELRTRCLAACPADKRDQLKALYEVHPYTGP